MKIDEVIHLLENNRLVFHSLLSGISNDFRLWRPAADKWNLHEIVCHLLDEEQLDFRARIKHVLEAADKPMPSINPTGWVIEKNYASLDFEKTIDLFLNERTQSIIFLKGLQEVNWQTVYHHTTLGTISAEQFLFNWLAHDYLHIRQINRYHYLFLKEKSGIDLSYAGDW